MVAGMTEGFSLAYVKELLVQSLLAIARRHAKVVAENAHQEVAESVGAPQSIRGIVVMMASQRIFEKIRSRRCCVDTLSP